jgi:superfamily II DNA or RNA helicase
MIRTATCAAFFSGNIRSRGLAYFRQHRVTIIDTDDRVLIATVEGSSRSDYEVVLEWEPDAHEITVACTCPYYDGGELCKHIWATMLAAEQAGWPQDAVMMPDMLIRRQDADVPSEEPSAPLNVLESFFEEMPGVRQSRLPAGRRQPRREKRKRARTSPWQRQLRQVLASTTQREERARHYNPYRQPRGRLVWYVWNVDTSLQEGDLVIEYYQQERRKNGSFGKIKRQGVTPNEIPHYEDPADQRVVQLLLGNESRTDGFNYFYAYYGQNPRHHSCAVAPIMYDLILPELCATGRFVWTRDDALPNEAPPSIRWDDGSPWHFALRCDPDDKRQCWRLRGVLTRGDETVDLNQPVILLANGLVLFQDCVSRLEAKDEFAWIVTLRKEKEITIPYTDRETFLQLWWEAPHLPVVDLPESLQLAAERGTPTGRFSVLQPREGFRDNRLYGTLALSYGDHPVDPDSFQAGIFDAKSQRVIIRDRDAETALMQQLADLGVRPNRGYYYDRGEYNFASRQLASLTENLVRTGWVVEAEGIRIRPPGTFKLNVTSGVDWFELDGEFDFDGVTASLPSLLEAVRRGESYVMLDDGSKGMLPDDWLAKYGKFANLGQADAKGVRFKASQALLLDALLAEQDNVAFDQGFQRWRHKLQAFDGVEPMPQPDMFNGQLRSYQKDGLGWLDFLRTFTFGGCLADDMGLGKTIQVLALLESCRARHAAEDGAHHPSIAVVPRSLVFNWVAEAARFTPQLRVLDYTGLGRSKALSRLDEYDLMVTTYGTLRRDIVKLKDIQFNYAILDESQAIKNADSQAAKACRLLQAEHRLAMTGTPVENHLGELWSLFEFLNPGLLGSSTAFSAMTKSGAGLDKDNLRVLAAGLRPFMLRRTKAQVLTELPEKTEQTIFCELPRAQRKLYNELRDYYRAMLSERVQKVGLKRAKIHVLEALLRLRQAACHPGLIDDERTNEQSAKMDALLEQLESIVAEGHKALVFSQFTSLLEIVRTHLDRHGIVYTYLDGRTRKRQERVDRFQADPDCPLFLISLKAGGHGLNLTAADYVFILDPWWNPAVEAQAIDRTHRIGQTRHVFAYRFICRDTVEEKILELQQHKRDLADAIVSADNSVMRNLTAEDLQLLLS